MKQNNIALYMAIGLACLSVTSFFVAINQSTIAMLSIATLLFSIAQAIESLLIYSLDNTRNSLEVNNKAGLINISEEMMAVMNLMVVNFNTDKKIKVLKTVSSGIYIIAFAVLFIGFAIPVRISTQIVSAITIVSLAMVFISLWFVDKQQKRKEEWDQVLMMSLMLKNDGNQNIEELGESKDSELTESQT